MNPDEHTKQELFLDVGDSHQLYIQDWGNPKAKTPILFLHGGPGGSVNDRHKMTFDPQLQRVIFFDQRGCGKSLPYGSLEHNTTPDLVEDIEKIAKHLDLPKFILYGGSWGSCLALAYALKYPKRVTAMVLRGIFTGSKSEVDWLDNGHFRIFFPEVWQKFIENTPAAHAQNPAAYHTERILGKNKSHAKSSSYILESLEGSLVSLDDRHTPSDPEEYDPTSIKIEVHYTTHGCFMPDRYLLDNARRLKMPIWLIQGRYDMVCPPITAWQLHQKLPGSQLLWTVAGHGNDRPNYDLSRTILLQLAAG